MIRLDNVTKHFGGRTLFDGISLDLLPGACIGLVGPNGAGKTTLFRLITGELEPDEGRLLVPRGMTVGLLPQSVGELSGGTVLERTLHVKSAALSLEHEMEELRGKLDRAASDAEASELSHRYGEIEEAYRIAGGYEMRADAKRILAGMGFEESDLERDVGELSGGWRMRLVLAGLLLQRPDVLLMDEPTNHLDVPSLEWIEGFLQSYEGTVVVISHDRYFLNRLVDRVASLEPDGIFVTPGTYDAYEKALEERNEQREKDKVAQEKEVARIEEFIDKFRYKASKSKQVQSRVKMLEKMERVQTVEARKRVSFRFPDAPRTGKKVITCEHVAKAFGPDKIIYDDLNFEIARGERIALVGPNGQGKSTLLKLLAEVLEPDEGSIELGHNVIRGYFAQHHIEGLGLDNTLLAEMESQATVDTFPQCRNILGSFLFSGDDVKKRIRVLSGGEKHRVALATLLLKPSNFLLLDEPTNHLDMASRAVLKNALKEFQGTVVVVSHDRAFLNGLATRMVHIEDGTAQSYLGDYDYYARKRKAQLAEIDEEAAEAAEQEAASDDDSSLSKKELRRLAAEERKLRKKHLGPLEKEFRTLEKEIDTLEAERSTLAAKLADVSFYTNGDTREFADVSKRHGELEGKIAKLMMRWEALGEEIETAMQDLTEALNS